MRAPSCSPSTTRPRGQRARGILEGDDKPPNPGPEEILGAHYSVALARDLQLTLDDQLIAHLACNRDRGPVNLVGLRLRLAALSAAVRPPAAMPEGP